MYIIVVSFSGLAVFIIALHLLAINRSRRFSCALQLRLCEAVIDLLRQEHSKAHVNLLFLKVNNPERIWAKYKSIGDVPNIKLFEDRLSAMQLRLQSFAISSHLEKEISELRTEIRDACDLCYSINNLYDRISKAKETVIEDFRVEIPKLIKSILDIVDSSNREVVKRFNDALNEFKLIEIDETSKATDWLYLNERVPVIKSTLQSVRSLL